jgi:cation transport ATPase
MKLNRNRKKLFKTLRQRGFELFIFTGDKQAAAEKVVADLGGNIVIKAEAKPEDKQQGIADLKNREK